MFSRKNPLYIRAIHDAKVMEIVKRYEAKGYVAALDASVGGQQFDVIFSHPQTKHQLAIEVLVRCDHQWQPENHATKMMEMPEIAKVHNLDLRFATVVMPDRGDIKIDWLNNAFQTYVEANQLAIRSDILPELNIQEIDIGIESFTANDEGAQAKGEGVIIIDHPIYEMELPFDGKFELDMQNKRIRHADIVFDYSYV